MVDVTLDILRAYTCIIVLFIFAVIRVVNPAFFEVLDGGFDVLKFAEHVFFLCSIILANFCRLTV